MPANLPPEAKAKLAKYSDAKSVEEKIRALEEFISVVPKHKGTENVLLWARKRLAELRREAEERARKRVGGGQGFFIEKEGAAQVAVIGPPNTGKSLLVARLTGARVAVSAYPFTTRKPVPGMLSFKDVKFQLIDTPPLLLESPDAQSNSLVAGIARNADALMLVIGLDVGDPVSLVQALLKLLESRGIGVGQAGGEVQIEKSRAVRGVVVEGDGVLVDATVKDLERVLSKYRLYNAVVKLRGRVRLSDIEEAILRPKIYKPCLVVLNKADLLPSREAGRLVKLVQESLPPGVGVVSVSAARGTGLESVGELLFEALGIIRVYTKNPHKDPDPEPLVLKKGATVIDVAARIRRDLPKRFRYAKIWGPSAKYPGMKVGAEHRVSDGDIVEIHAW
ncbi:MAG: TGS domain-containing protein [Desulfurococcales archaeon]|nr:TGS domain-containing protein [Desulfurococcales archaeon]